VKRWLPISLLAALAALALFAGCGSEKYSMSDNVRFLWQQHPAPYSEAAARAAAKDANGLIEAHPHDFQLKLYYIDRMRAVARDSLIKVYSKKLEKDSTDARLMLLAAKVDGGRAYMAAMLKKAVELAPQDPYVLAYTAEALLRNRPPEPDKALDYARSAAEIAPEMSLAHEALAQALLADKKNEEALQEAETASELDPFNFDPVHTAMRALQAMGKDDEALARVESFVDDQPLNQEALYYLQRMYQKAGHLEKILPRMRTSAKALPQEGYAYIDLASVYQELAMTDSVLLALNHAVDHGFCDLDYTKAQFDEDAFKQPDQKQAWQKIQDRMQKVREETRDERRSKALADSLAIPAPDFTAMTFDMKKVGLDDLKGKVTVLDFWATWCGPCRMTIPRLQDFHNAGAHGAQLVSMNVWESRMPPDDRAGLVEQFAQKEGMNWHVWLAENQTALDYEVSGIPTFFVIDKQGIIRYKLVGYQPFLDETLGWMVDAAKSM